LIVLGLKICDSGIGTNLPDERQRKEIVFMETMTVVIGAVIVIAALVSNFTILK